MATTVKMCDMSKEIAAVVFRMLNYGKVLLKDHDFCGKVIITDTEPKYLVYPEGWYYAKGTFRNKHNSTSGMYEEVPMIKSNGDWWGHIANYSTKN